MIRYVIRQQRDCPWQYDLIDTHRSVRGIRSYYIAQGLTQVVAQLWANRLNEQGEEHAP